jgi:2,4-dienoyl-CoA reductase-like NADH-dependent reductase (Old Yellow Enzyme family)
MSKFTVWKRRISVSLHAWPQELVLMRPDLESWGFKDVTLKTFRDIFGDTPFFSAGGWNDKNTWGVLEEKTYDAFAIGRLFLSTPDLVKRW